MKSLYRSILDSDDAVQKNIDSVFDGMITIGFDDIIKDNQLYQLDWNDDEYMNIINLKSGIGAIRIWYNKRSKMLTIEGIHSNNHPKKHSRSTIEHMPSIHLQCKKKFTENLHIGIMGVGMGEDKILIIDKNLDSSGVSITLQDSIIPNLEDVVKQFKNTYINRSRVQ